MRVSLFFTGVVLGFILGIAIAKREHTGFYPAGIRSELGVCKVSCTIPADVPRYISLWCQPATKEEATPGLGEGAAEDE